jgi:hypothetical protein
LALKVESFAGEIAVSGVRSLAEIYDSDGKSHRDNGIIHDPMPSHAPTRSFMSSVLATCRDDGEEMNLLKFDP